MNSDESMNFGDKEINRIIRHLDEAKDGLQKLKGREDTMQALKDFVVDHRLGADKLSLTIKELSDKSGISTATLNRYKTNGRLKTCEVEGGKTIVLKEDALNFLKSLKKD